MFPVKTSILSDLFLLSFFSNDSFSQFLYKKSIPVEPFSSSINCPSTILNFFVPYINASKLRFNCFKAINAFGVINLPLRSIYANLFLLSSTDKPNISVENNPFLDGVIPLSKLIGSDTSSHPFSFVNLSGSNNQTFILLSPLFLYSDVNCEYSSSYISIEDTSICW